MSRKKVNAKKVVSIPKQHEKFMGFTFTNDDKLWKQQQQLKNQR